MSSEPSGRSDGTPRSVDSFEALANHVGEELAASDWLLLSQERINDFARTTSDFQWIHTDPERARLESPYGSTVAHGFLTLSLLAPLFASALTIGGTKMSLNYGLDRVRFITPVLSGDRIRAHFKLQAYKNLDPGAQLTWTATVMRAGIDKPALVAEWLMRCYP